MAYLVVSMKGKELYRRELSGPVTLGRSTDCDLWINDAGISRQHCRFERAGNGWAVQDLGSRNGMFVEGERVAQRALKDGDVVRIGEAKIRFHEVGFVSSRPARPQGAGDSMSDTIVSNSASRWGRALPTPRAATPGKTQPAVPKPAAPEPMPVASAPAAPLAFSRPPARPIPAATDESPDDTNGKHREGFLHRLLHPK